MKPISWSRNVELKRSGGAAPSYRYLELIAALATGEGHNMQFLATKRHKKPEMFDFPRCNTEFMRILEQLLELTVFLGGYKTTDT